MRTLNPCSARTIAALLLAFAVGGEAFAQALTPRAPIQKRPIDQVVATPGAVTGEIVVKFHDEALARLDASGNLSFNGPARGGQRAKQLLSGFSLSTAIKATHDEMYSVMQSAALHSGVASPDLPGMLSVKLDPESPAAIQKLARQLHALDCVEYATIMETLRPASVSLAGPAPVGSCAVTNVTPPLCLAGMTEAECDELDGTWNEGQESCGFLDPAAPVGPCCIDLGFGPACIDGVPSTACLDAGGQFFGPFLDVDDDGDGQFDLNPVGEAFSCNDPNRVTTCAPGEEEEGACCLAAGGTASSGACVDLPFLECVNAGGVYSHIWSLIQGSDNGLCVYGEDDEIDCPEAACDPVGQLGIHVSMDFTANVSCFGATGLAMPGCSDGVCCELVTAIDPFCSLFQDSGINGQWDFFCQATARVLCAPPSAARATLTPYTGQLYDQTGDPGASSPDVVSIVTAIDPSCEQGNWSLACAEIARLFAYRTSAVVIDDGATAGPATPDFSGLQYNLDDEGWPYRSRSAYIAARDGGLLDVGEQQYFEGMPFQEAWVFGNPVLNWPLGFNGVGLGLRGKPGEPFDYSDDDGDGLPDASDITNDGWFEPGENWGDWGIDGQPAVLLGGAPGAPIPVIGGHIDGGDADLGDPVNCSVVTDPAYFTTSDDGECDGLWTGPTGGDGFAWRIARDDPNGTGDPLLDRTGLMSEDPSVDRGDELFRGRGAKVAVLDFSFWRGHEDIERIEMEVTPNGRVVPRLDANGEEIPTITWSRDTEARYLPRKPYVIVEEGVTMVTIPEIGYPDHGTAVLGQLSALDEARDWGEPALGITGIVPEAQPYFFALFSREDGNREVTAWFRAVAELGPGDVICAAYDPAGINTSCAENEAVVTISQLAFREGIVSVVAAGNGRQECIPAIGAGGGDDDGAEDGMFIVGGLTPAGPGQAHRHAESNYGAAVDAAAWGDYVVSTGYGDLFSAVQPANPNDLGVDRRRAYTARFGGTSAATAQIAGAACALQGLARQYFQIPANPGGLRDIAMKPYPADGAPNTEAVVTGNSGRANFEGDISGNFGIDADGDGRLDGVYEAQPEGIEVTLGTYPRIWGFADDSSAVVQLLTLDGAVVNNEAQNLTALFPVKGEIAGNIYNVKGEDGSILIATSEYALGGEGADGLALPDVLDGSVPDGIEEILNKAIRPVSGEVTDVALLHQVESLPETIVGIEATLALRQPVSPIIVVGFALWDFQSRRWQTVDVEVITDEDEPNEQGNIELELEVTGGSGYARRYINSDGKNWARVWTWGFGDVFGGAPEYSILWDLMNVQFLDSGNDQPG